MYSDAHGGGSSEDAVEAMTGFMQMFYSDLQRCVGQDGAKWE